MRGEADAGGPVSTDHTDVDEREPRLTARRVPGRSRSEGLAGRLGARGLEVDGCWGSPWPAAGEGRASRIMLRDGVRGLRNVVADSGSSRWWAGAKARAGRALESMAGASARASVARVSPQRSLQPHYSHSPSQRLLVRSPAAPCRRRRRTIRSRTTCAAVLPLAAPGPALGRVR